LIPFSKKKLLQMQSEQQHIDNFFRQKEESYTPDNSRQDAHWLQLQQQLVKPTPVPPGKNVRVITTRRIVKYLGGFAVVTIITILALRVVKENSKKVTPKKATVASHSTVKPRTAAPKKQTTAATLPAVTRKPAARKPVVQKRKTIPKPVSRAIAAHIPAPPAAPKQHVVLSEAASKALLTQFYSELQKEPQVFSILPDRDTTITGREGTRIYIPAYAFARKNGIVRTGTVRLVLTEYYQYDDILAAKLSTTSNGEQLVSGGMLHLQAESGGEQLNVMPDKGLEIKMPTNDYDERMQLFRASTVPPTTAEMTRIGFIENRQIDTIRPVLLQLPDNTTVNWQPAGQWQWVSGERTLSQIKVLNLAAQPWRIRHGKKTVARFLLSKSIDIPENKVRQLIFARSNGYYDKIKIKRTGLNSSDVIDSVSMEFNRACHNKLVSRADSIRFREQQREDSIAHIMKMKHLKNYNFYITNLGWINCDRWLKDPRPKVEFTINLGTDIKANHFVSQLIFTRYRSVMTGFCAESKVQFRNIPENEPVQLVSLGVKDGKVVYCIQPLTVSNREVNNLTLVETTPEQFRQKLAELKIVAEN
jgi:hypothetical protein